MKQALLRRHASTMAVIALGMAAGFAAPRVVQWFRPAYISGDYQTQFQTHAARVILYGTQRCSYCIKARRFLQDRQVPFADLDIEKSPQAAAELQALGQSRSVPVLLVGKRLIVGFNPQAFEDALAQGRP